MLDLRNLRHPRRRIQPGLDASGIINGILNGPIRGKGRPLNSCESGNHDRRLIRDPRLENASCSTRGQIVRQEAAADVPAEGNIG